MARKRNYVGVKVVVGEGTTYERFLSDVTPTEATHGDRFGIVMGPFSTKLGALCHVHFGDRNPHTTTVAACERIGKKYADDLADKPDRKFIRSVV